MNAQELIAKYSGDIYLFKFIALASLTNLWPFDPEKDINNVNKRHLSKAKDLGLLVNKTTLKEGVLAGSLRIANGQILFVNGSSKFPRNKPSDEQFQAIQNGQFRII